MDTIAIVNLTAFGVLFLSAAIGFAKGFIEQAVELVGAIASFVVAILMAGSLATYVEQKLDASYSVALVVSFIFIVIACLVLTHFVALGFGRLAKMTILKVVDRLTGAGLGLIFGMIVCSLAISLVLELPLSDRFRNDVARASMSLFLRPIAGEVYNWVVDRLSGEKHFEDIFKRGNTV